VPQASLLLKIARAESKLGQYKAALTSAERSRHILTGNTSLEAGRLLPKIICCGALMHQRQGRIAEASKWAQQAAVAAEAFDDWESIGEAHIILGWASGVDGRDDGEHHLQNALNAFERAGDRFGIANASMNLGVIFQWEGRWDEAIEAYERGREELAKIGDLSSTVAYMNVAEILIDRGEFSEAEDLLQKTLPLWKSSEYRFFLGACELLLGRLLSRWGKIDEAQAVLKKARTTLAAIGAGQELLDVDAQLTECQLFVGDPDAAIAFCGEALAQKGPATARLLPRLQRVRGYGLLLRNEFADARQAFEASLAIARERNDVFEIARTLHALDELGGKEGWAASHTDEIQAILARLKVRRLPATPSDKFS
jgi:tetratricopeptide (TPR) repeat protein